MKACRGFKGEGKRASKCRKSTSVTELQTKLVGWEKVTVASKTQLNQVEKTAAHQLEEEKCRLEKLDKIQKTIWIINQYASTPDSGMGGRHYYLAKYLARKGHKVYLIAALYTHLLRNPPKIEENIFMENRGFSFCMD